MPHPIPCCKASGFFFEYADQMRFKEAFAEIEFSKALPSFATTGVSPKESELACSRWIFGVVSEALDDCLRINGEEPEILEKGMREIQLLTAEAEKVFADQEPMADLLTVLRSLRILFETAASRRDDRIEHAPSTLRQAIAHLDRIPPHRGALALGLAWGNAGSGAMRRVKDLLGASAKDEVGVNQFDKHIADLNSLFPDEGEAFIFEHEAVLGVIHGMVSALNMWSTSTLEEKLQEVADALVSIDRFIQLGASMAFSAAQQELQPQLKPLWAAIAALQESPGAGAKEPTLQGTRGPSAEPMAEKAFSVDSLEALVESWEGEVVSVWMLVVNLYEVAIKAKVSIAEAMSSASITFVGAPDLEATKAQADGLLEGMRIIQQMFDSAKCILSGKIKASYADLLAAFSEWVELPRDNQGELGPPVLELVVRGAKAAFNLKNWLDTCPSTPCGPFGGCIVVSIGKEVADSVLGLEFTKAVMDNIGHSLHIVQRSSHLPLLSLQDVATIERLASEKRSGVGFALLLGGGFVGNEGSSSSSSTLSLVQKTSSDILRQNNGKLPENPNWPHLASIGMAKQLLSIVDEKMEDAGQAMAPSMESHPPCGSS